MGKEEKSPLGVKPRFIWEEECRQKRIVDLRNAMNRFIEAKRDIPYLWVVELDELERLSQEYELEYNVAPDVE